MNDQLLWINHAGFELRSEEFRLVCDPWMEGQVFNDGWDLISPTRFKYEDFRGVDYIWFSHEHPDHFNPRNVKKIPEDIRKNITVLFQKTRDRRVARFCEQSGFRVRELPEWERVPLKSGAFITCKTDGSDSFAMIETRQRTYLNLNDCAPAEPAKFWSAAARRLSRPADVMLTQFSYANWAGNPGEMETMRRAAAEKTESIDIQLRTFRPKFWMPFASHVWFCRMDNFHLNEGANTIASIFASYGEKKPPCVVLYPGDLWTVGEPFASEKNVKRYMADLAAHTQPLDLSPKPIPWHALRTLCAEQQQKLHSGNGRVALSLLDRSGFMKPVGIFVRDLGAGITYAGLRGIVDDNVPLQKCHIELSSDSLADAFKFGYGSDTLMVNGRFRELVPGGRFVFIRNFLVQRHNDHGRRVPNLLLKPQFLKFHLRGFFKRTGEAA